jgi:hypothetical protein
MLLKDMFFPGLPGLALVVLGRAAVGIISWLRLPAAVQELEAPATTGKFFSAVRLDISFFLSGVATGVVRIPDHGRENVKQE